MARRPTPEPAHEIDLHGARLEPALRRMAQELYTCRVRALTPVLVITGRGWGSATGRSVLREEVEAWLRGSAGREAGVVQCKSVHKGGAFHVDLAPPAA